MKLQQKLTFLVVFSISIFLINNAEASEENVSISSISYTNDLENGELITLVSNGKENGTLHKYKLFDDDDDDCDFQNCIPENWYTTNFDDSEWGMNATPFGNEEIGGVTPNTIWQSEGGKEDYLIVRHYFNYEKPEEVLSSTLKIAHNNYYIAYLNGNLIRDCSWYQNHDGCYEDDPDYWNNILTYDGSQSSGPNPDWLVEGENVLAILAIDITWGGDTEQWLDFELAINVPSWKDVPVVLGDDLALRVEYRNHGENNASNLNVSIEIDNLNYVNQTISIESNQTYEWIVEWTPTKLGIINVTAYVGDQSLTRTIHIGFYAYSLDFNDRHKTTGINENIQYYFNITNLGDVDDNFTFGLNNFPSDWNYDFIPNVANLSPDETAEIILNITVSDNAQAGNYSIFPIVWSQYYSQTIETLIHSGVTNSTQYSYQIWNNSEFPNDFYEISYNDSGWDIGSAPFGNEELRGIAPNTLWITDDQNYTHISTRHWFDYDGDLDFSELRVKIAHDDYFRVYLNDNLIRDCFSGWGCGGNGNYWEEEININKSWLNEGQNLLAVAARDNTQGWGGGGGGDGRQWLDQELELANLRSKLWDFQEIYEKLTLTVNETYEYEILTPIVTKELADTEPYEFTIWILNRGNVEDTYNISINLNDTDNFNIVSFNEQIKIPYGADGNIELVISINENIDEFDLAEFNITITSLNSTDSIIKQTTVFAKMYVPPDLVAPATYAVSPQLVNSTSFEVQWFVQEWYKNNLESGNDTKYIIIQFSHDNGTNGELWSDWEIWGNFSTEEGKTIFNGAKNNYQYRFRSIGGDDDGKIEDKEDKVDNITFVDLESPTIFFTNIASSLSESTSIEDNATNIKTIEFSWDAEDNNEIITGFDFYYKINNGQWIIKDEDFTQKTLAFYAENDGLYEFKIVGEDLAGNIGFDTSNSILVDTIGPNVTITEIPGLTDLENIVINMDNLDDITNFTILYKLNKEGESNANLDWQEYGEYQPQSLPLEIPVLNQYEYQFKILAYDTVGNKGEDIAYTLIDRDKPTKIRNLQIAQGKTVVNSTTDVLISFMSSQSQDLIEYRIYRSESVNETGELISSLVYGEQYLSYKDSNVLMNKIYYYSIVAVDRMNFESEPEKAFLDLTVEEKIVVKESDDESNLGTILIGLGIIGGTAAVIAYVSRKSTEEIVQVIADLPEEIGKEKFSEMDGELLCNACGAMFDTTETSCPSCGTLKE